MILTSRVIEKLKVQARESCGRIKDLFEKGSIHFDNGAVGWGQFLDEGRDNTQFGIYGTSAGVQVLVLHRYPEENPHVSGSLQLLNDALTNENSHFKKKGDVYNVYKLVFLADAQEPKRAEIDEDNMVMKKLIDSRVSGLGWGEYTASSSDKDHVPKIVATALCLLSLRRYKPFFLGKECRESVEWLCLRVLDNGNLRAHQLALAGLALVRYKELTNGWNSYDSALSACTEKLLGWISSARKMEIGEFEVYNYSKVIDAQQSNSYLFFLPDCLTAFYFLQQRVTAPEAQDYVARVVKYFCSEISSRGGFVARQTSKMSTVDHLWLYRLMHEVSFGNWLRPRRIFQVISKRTRVILGTVFLVAGAFGLYLAHTFERQTTVYIIGSLLAVIGLGLVYTLISERLRENNRVGS